MWQIHSKATGQYIAEYSNPLDCIKALLLIVGNVRLSLITEFYEIRRA